ncbi:depupylase/deamidase Dop [Corynebacterium sp. 153RC1]|uniref:depupylase/deamidase Dop n=1 Tax=unclassified Corynebacterium TaxID=2624378 RepID=UPI00211C81E4|nr:MULTISPECIES: depupylase/deamidase Dop [unclassified Corynebacterium]MCQ9370242.1 depupylase/deamidase Dop [Corynebacterium sp. 35RC1]MCQ9352441.1 depupylase/deamidase Dop [Corynebacterium sp. 209RC1]MCQ9354387.1 depupylase/deamidase Dop [Corynebacterium sp. 1222RC1]MCQ9356724.1 depupylase/deamidase Dop [Corynebacterium sp. 122RC1]MCQ9358782.1 depupylase/deamidase Dop [Corynebacterium sp. 142RC1]
MIVIGSETEYGISTPDNPTLSPISTSTHAVVAYSLDQRCATNVRWDFGSEHPLRDRRGFDLRRYDTVPVVDPHAIGVANTVLGNGGRFYVDHAHPEYSSPEVTNALDAVLYDAAGDHILLKAAALVAEHTAQGHSVLEHHEPAPALRIYKNNTDGKGASYGAHENYLYPRDLDFQVLAQALIPFFVARQVFIGAGRVGLGQHGEQPGFQISQRADFIETEISLETTLNRGIINTRDEPHAQADSFGRLHVIIGDANLSHTSNLLKFGLTSLVLEAVIAGETFSDLALQHPVTEVQRVSRDLSLTHRLTLKDGQELTARELIAEYLARVQPRTPTDEHVLATYREVDTLLAQGPLAAAQHLDWCAKYSLITSFQARGVDIADAKMQLIDLQYADIDPAKSLYHALVRQGKMRTLFSAEEIAQAALVPPTDTRAYLRGEVIRRFDSAVVASSWESFTLAAGEQEEKLWRVVLSDPLAMGKADAEPLLRGDVGTLLSGLEQAPGVETILLPATQY